MKVGKILSPFEREVAALARAGYGRSGIAAALGISPGTVKVVLRQIRWKLGENWREHPWLGEPVQECGPTNGEGAPLPEATLGFAEAAAAQEASETVTAGPAPGEATVRWEQEAREGRRLASLILVCARTRTILKVSGSQRFFLKPVLATLEAEGHLRLLAADRNDVFDPPWLPIVNRGRKAVRAARYLVRDDARVRAALEEYFSAGLAFYVQGLLQRLATARSLAGYWRRVNLPGAREMWGDVRKAFGLSGDTFGE